MPREDGVPPCPCAGKAKRWLTTGQAGNSRGEHLTGLHRPAQPLFLGDHERQFIDYELALAFVECPVQRVVR